MTRTIFLGLGVHFFLAVCFAGPGGNHAASRNSQRPPATNVISHYDYLYFGVVRTPQDCIARVRPSGASHYYFGRGQVGGRIYQNVCFSAKPRFRENLPQSVTKAPSGTQSPPAAPSTSRSASEEPAKVWTRSPSETPVTQKVADHQGAFDKFSKKMGEKGLAPLDPAGPWTSKCLRVNTHPHPSYKPFFAVSSLPMVREMLFTTSENKSIVQFGDTKLERKADTMGFTNYEEFPGVKYYRSLSELNHVGLEGDAKLPVTLDSHIWSEMKFFRSPAGETYAMLHMKHDFVNRMVPSGQLFPAHSTDEYCVYTQKKSDPRDPLQLAKELI
jgi:hypothetical protein